jgi:hypothetical protein
MTISIPAGDLEWNSNIDPTADLTKETKPLYTIASVSGGNGTTIELLILLQLP